MTQSPTMDFSDAIRGLLLSDAKVQGILGDAIYDGAPSTRQNIYIVLGPSDFIPLDIDCLDVTEETIQLDIWHRGDQFALGPCRNTVRAVFDALHGKPVTLETHASGFVLVEQARTFADPSGKWAHGVVVVTAEIERR